MQISTPFFVFFRAAIRELESTHREKLKSGLAALNEKRSHEIGEGSQMAIFRNELCHQPYCEVATPGCIPNYLSAFIALSLFNGYLAGDILWGTFFITALLQKHTARSIVDMVHEFYSLVKPSFITRSFSGELLIEHKARSFSTPPPLLKQYSRFTYPSGQNQMGWHVS